MSQKLDLIEANATYAAAYCEWSRNKTDMNLYRLQFYAASLNLTIQNLKPNHHVSNLQTERPERDNTGSKIAA